MDERIVCPQCQFEFEVAEALAAQLSDKIRKDLEGEFQKRAKKFDAQQEALKLQQQELQDKRQDFESHLQKALNEQKRELYRQAKEEAKLAFALELKDTESQLSEVRKQLKKTEQTELDLRRAKRELEEEKRTLALQVERRVSGELEEVRKLVRK